MSTKLTFSFIFLVVCDTTYTKTFIKKKVALKYICCMKVLVFQEELEREDSLTLR